MSKPLPCILSVAADKDLEEIYDYSLLKFGESQTLVYLAGLENAFENLSDNQSLGRPRDEIRNQLRSISYQSHTIFYAVLNGELVIMRILHASRNVIKFLYDHE